ncbi:unannotated protein [freshwater metagenome]|uniref:Unannotated protein n=1 Tax=freshwater metagenome TaxID=449393 RepID=A0A6J6D9A0_9ZZZZ
MIGVDLTKQEAGLLGGVVNLLGPTGNVHEERVEERVVQHHHARGRQATREVSGLVVNVLCDLAQAFGAVIDRVHTRHDGKQNLCGTNV